MIMQTFQNKLITIIGNVGLGKSTLCETLSRELPARLIPADKFFEINPFFPLAVEDRKRWSLASDLWFLKERVKMARETEKVLETESVVVDSGILMSYVYAYSRVDAGFLTQDEWELYQELYNELTADLRQPDVVIYLTGSVEFARKRVEQRGREFEVKHHSVEYLSGIQKSLDFLIEYLKESGVKVVSIDVENTTDKLDLLFKDLMK